MLKNKLFRYFCMMSGAVARWIFILSGLLFPVISDNFKQFYRHANRFRKSATGGNTSRVISPLTIP